MMPKLLLLLHFTNLMNKKIMKKILGLDLGTNSIGWAVTKFDIEKKEGKIIDLGSRIIPMSQDILGKFDAGQSIPQTAERTGYRGVRRLYQRDNLRRDRLHRVLNVLGFLPEHYKNEIDIENNFGQFKEGKEPKINYRQNSQGKFEFIFMDSFLEMVKEFEQAEQTTKIPLDWTIYYLRKKALKKKITKEELAWILLNFNQKRGYYQLRGEEEEKDSNKQEKYYALKVKEVEETKDTNNKGTWYNIVLENNFVYRRQSKEPLNNWVGLTKEFIVTTTIDKEGNPQKDKEGDIKRSFRAVDSEKDWIAIKEKTQNEIEKYNKDNDTIGVANFIFDSLLKNPTQKIRGKLIKTIERKYYRKELEAILEKQIELQPELFSKEKYSECINELYKKNEAHKSNIKDKGFKYLFVDDIIFYQRPLKSQKSNISGCQYEKRPMKDKDGNLLKDENGKTITNPIPAVPKSHPLFQEFRLWQFLRNLKILQKQATIDGKPKVNYDITNTILQTEEDWVNLFDFLNDKKDVNQKQILTHLKFNKNELNNYRWNYVEDDSKKYPANETRAQFLSRLKKVENKPELNDEQIIDLWHIIYSVKDPEQFQKALGTFALKNNLHEESFIEAFKKFPPFDSDYGAYSLKAIKKILPLMRQGKYWNENEISDKIKSRISEYMERVKNITVDKNHKDFSKQLENVSDDDIPKQLIKSFLPFKDKNPLSGLNTYQACYAVYERHSEVSEIQNWKTPEDIDKYLQNFKQHSLRNPIVEQVVTETLRTVRDIWKKYGDFDEIHLELGREMKNPADKRKRLTQKVTENENTNFRIKQILTELMNDGINEVKPYSPSQQEILKIYEEGLIKNPDTNYQHLKEDEVEKIRKNSSPSKNDIKKYKLWLEQGYISPYTGQTISLSKLFSTDYQIEHIIPQSRYFDDSLSNKIICESAVNELKSNQTAYEFIKNHGGETVELGQGNNVEILKLDAYITHCKRYFSNNYTKLNKLLSEDIPDSFIERQMNDSRYISKFVKGLLSNIVREENENDATSKNLVPVTGAITSTLKQDWGLNDIWNDIVAPRFKRLNEITNSNDFGYFDEKINSFRTQVPKDIEKGFNKKRIDHRHHALDALIIAMTSKKHIQYLNSLNNEKEKYDLQPSLMIKNKNGHYTKHFKKPWDNFTLDAKTVLEKTIISFKSNLRVINRTNNKIWKYVKQKNGSYKKELVEQKGKNFAIRKPMHKETVSGKVTIRDKKTVSFSNIFDEKYQIVDKKLKNKIKELKKDGFDTKKIKKYFKDKKYKFNDSDISKVEVYYWFEATATRVELNDKFKQKHLDAITDTGIKKILNNHLKNYLDEKGNPQYELAFNVAGLDELNKNIVELNEGKQHAPIRKVRIYEEGSKFPISQNENSAKNRKYVEAAKGTNLFFAIYWDEDKKKRVYETIPLHEVIEHQKQTANLPVKEKLPIPINPEMGKFLFYLSPNDLVYVPTDSEIENPSSVDFNNLNKEQVERIYKMVSSSSYSAYFLRNDIANSIINKKEFGLLNKSEKTTNEVMIKERCWKLKVNRLGKIIGKEIY